MCVGVTGIQQTTKIHLHTIDELSRGNRKSCENSFTMVLATVCVRECCVLLVRVLGHVQAFLCCCYSEFFIVESL